MLTDPIADFINRLQNASRARRDVVKLPSSKMKLAIAHVLAKRGFLSTVHEEPEGARKQLVVSLPANRETPLEFKRVSKPGQRIYVGCEDVKRVKSGIGAAVISTSKGVMDDDHARIQKLGGELLFTVS